MKRYLAEAIGTFALVFCGAGAIVINDVSEGAVTHVGIAIVFGLIVMAMIFSFGGTSGAHINPAVTISFAITDRFKRSDLIPYIIAQVIGAILAAFLLKILFPLHSNLGSTLPSGSVTQSFILEVVLTYFLMLVILMVSQNKTTKPFTAIAVGGTVLLEAMFAGPICGASMNPARSIGPALVSGELTALWAYIVAPILGALLATGTWIYLKEDEPS